MVESIKQPQEPAALKIMSYFRYPFAFIGGMIATGLACTVFTLFSMIFRNKTVDRYVIRGWATTSCFLFGLKVRPSGLENLPEEGCLILFNHASLFDIPIMYSVIPKDYRYGAKAELFKIPIFGMALKTMGALPIHRARRDDVLKLYEESVVRVDNGESFALAPEGTRQKEPNIGRFKSGPFIFAIQAKTKVVPVVIKGALETLGKDDWIVNRGRWNREVHMQVLKPISAEGYTQEQIGEFQEAVRVKMVEAYETMN